MSLYEPVLVACGRALRPLQRGLTDPDALGALLADLGWQAVPGPDDLGRLADLLPVADIERVLEIVQPVATNGSLSLDVLAELVTLLDDITRSIRGLSELSPDDVSEMSAELADPALWSDVAAVLAEHLLVRFLEDDIPAIALLLRLTGVVAWEQRGPSARVGRWRLHWDRLSDLFADPLEALKETVAWGPTFFPDRLLAHLRLVTARLGLATTLAPMSEAVRDAIGSEGRGEPSALVQSELVIARANPGPGVPIEAGIVVASAATASAPAGLYVGNLCSGLLDGMAGIGTWTLSIDGGATGTATVGAVVRPDGTSAVGTIPSGKVSLRLTGEPEQPWRLVGSASGTRVELGGLELALGLTLGPEAEIWASLDTVGDGLTVVIDLGPADNFLRAVTGGAIPTVSCAGGLRLGSRSGLTASGDLGVAVTIPVERQIGPLYVTDLTVDLGAGDGDGDGDVELGLAIGASLTIGPFTALADGIGAALVIAADPSGGGFAGIDAALDFRPPAVIGFELDTEGARGGGFVSIDAELGRYSGALSLDVLSLGIDAIVVIDTRLPGDPDGWALFASLAASFPGIPLGFGFTLNGVGGLLALNRTMDAEALAGGLRNGAIDALLFPDDPVGDSAELVAQIDDYFPLRDGNTVIGPVIEVGWGTPTLITAQLGVVISLPDGVIAVMGSVEALLPVPDAPLITLHMDTLGVIDAGAGTFSLTGSLYDSRLLEAIDLSGDMAMYLQATSQPYFLLSVGGFHPGFEPPSLVPASMHDLRRMQASISIASNVSVAVQAYFAVTSNSVQFGASVDVTASVEVALATYTAKGWFGFDVLLVFSPFKIVASMSAGVGIYAGDRELMGVQLSLVLEGPEPWYAAGQASFRFFGLKVNFDLDVGSKAAGEPKPIAHPRADVLDALRSPGSWAEAGPLDGLAAGITYTAGAEDDAVVWVRPDHQLTVRQSVAPLNRSLAIVGQAVPAAGEDLMTVTGAGFTGQPDVDWDLAQDWFAPAQFEVLDRSDKLTRASFELMTAGVTFGAPLVAVTEQDGLCTSVTTDYEEERWRPEDTSLTASVRTGAAGTGLRHFVTPAIRPTFVVEPSAFTVVRAADGVEAGLVLRDAGVAAGGVSQHDALHARRTAVAGDPSQAAKLVLVPMAAASEPAP